MTHQRSARPRRPVAMAAVTVLAAAVLGSAAVAWWSMSSEESATDGALSGPAADPSTPDDLTSGDQAGDRTADAPSGAATGADEPAPDGDRDDGTARSDEGPSPSGDALGDGLDEVSALEAEPQVVDASGRDLVIVDPQAEVPSLASVSELTDDVDEVLASLTVPDDAQIITARPGPSGYVHYRTTHPLDGAVAGTLDGLLQRGATYVHDPARTADTADVVVALEGRTTVGIVAERLEDTTEVTLQLAD